MSAVVGKLVESYSGFDPRNIPGCVAWYDAADSNTVTLSGTNLSKWFDKSSNSNAMITDNAAYTAYSNIINGLKTVSLNGIAGITASISNSNAFTVTSPHTIIILARPRTTSVAGSYALLKGASNAFEYNPGTGSNLSVYNGASATQGNTIVFSSNTTRIHEAINNGTSSFLGANGTVVTNGGSPGTTNWTNLILNTYPTVVQQGDWGEILVYSGALSSNDRQQVEGYLGWKWGLPSNLPATHPYRGYVRPFTRPFRPLDISGCAVWLDAADRSTILTSGNTSNVVQWNDKSGNSNNAATGGGYSNPFYSSVSNSLQFAGSNALTTSYTATPTAETLFVVASFTGTTNNANYGILGTSTLGARGYNLFRSSGGVNRVSWNIYATGDRGSTSNVPQTTRFLTTGVYSANSMTTSLNGGNQSAVAANTFAGGGTTIVGSLGGAGVGFVGNINEIILYSSNLTVSQYRLVEGYLADKWGLRGDISGGHPFKSLPPFYPAFTPLQISNCVMWLDAADISGLTLSGSNVTSWIDKSGSGNSCSQATASSQPTYLSTDRSVNFNGSNFLLSTYTALLSNGTTSIFAAFTPTAVGTRENTMIGANGGVGNLAVVTNQQSTHGNFGVNGVARGFGSFTVRTTFSNLPSVGLITISNNVTTAYANGGSAAGNVTIVFVNAATVFGGYFSSGSFYTVDSYIGKIHEVLFYNRIVTTAERYRIEGYLANKWKVGLVQTTAVPTDYSNCALWLDAADISSIDLSGSNVTVWRDKSGNNYNASNTANKGPTYSGGVLNFNGTSNSLSVPTFTMPSSNHCLIAVHRPTTITGNNQGNTNIFRWQAPFYIAFPYMNATTPRGYVSSTATAAIDAITSTLVERSVTTGYNVITANIASGSQLIYRNGVLMSSASEAMKPNQAMLNFAIGSTVDTLSEFYQGSIAEMIVFSRQLTSNERAAIENRLISKWNALGLPSQHPYKNSIA